ncbi:hypothetical protein [Tuberibacillus sp. Marseille-P3662]|uniref:hypothetical protein n=1 Tax=Tuberibacillus sp. Marseille-P3662 TaxID=1965358 RepID=UPI000A1CA272|nr:hypothetical protein [Tuberibacillus sp. Marseille-P3662]
MNQSKKEPIKQVKSWVILGIIIILSVPWYFPTGSYEPLFFGVPYWAFIVIGVSFILSAFINYVIKYQWNLIEDEEEQAKEDE